MGMKKPTAGVNVFPWGLGLAPGGAVRGQEEGFPARRRWSWRQRVEQKEKSR